jgi:ATP-dependent Clp protease ATP-binding subunit ClpB
VDKKDSPVQEDTIRLNPELANKEVLEFENRLRKRLVGQDRVVRKVAEIYQVFQAGLSSPSRPLANLLLLGPTGTGKTYVVESSAEIFFETPQAFLKVDCGELQHSHEIAKLIGSPPGYLGHRETCPALTQEVLDRHRNQKNDFSLVLFDEIEKASPAFWQLLLGILDKATLTLGDNRKVDFSKCIIFMTSNLGAKEMSQLLEGSIGFAPKASEAMETSDLDKRIYRTALEAAKRNFSPEFMNRIDSVEVFRTLSPTHFQRILDLELAAIQEQILQKAQQKFFFRCTADAKSILLREGIHPAYGARNIKRVLNRMLLTPIAHLLASGQLVTGDFLTVDNDPSQQNLIFYKHQKATQTRPLQAVHAAPWFQPEVTGVKENTAAAA